MNIDFGRVGCSDGLRCFDRPEIAKDELQHTSEFDLDAWSKSFESVVEKAKALEASSVERIKVLEQELVEIQAEMVSEAMNLVTVG